MILSLEEEGKEEIGLSEIESRARVNRGYARKIAHTLMAKHWLQALGRGRYLLNPSRHGVPALPDTDPLRFGSHLVRPYYFGFATAAELWGFLLQPGRVYYVVTTARTSLRPRHPARFQFVRVAPRRFFGVTTTVRRGESIVVSDRERTVLDALARPAISGGMMGAVQTLARARPKLDWERLSGYLTRLGSRSLSLRLGYLSELLGGRNPPPPEWVRRWRARPGEPWVPLGAPGSFGRKGPREERWHIIRNVPERLLRSEVDGR